MSDTKPVHSITDDAIEIRFPPAKQGLLSRLMVKPSARSFTELAPEDRDLLFSIGDLRAWGDTHPDEVTIASDHLRISHDAAASLSAPAADALGLPRAVDLILKTDVTGVLGRPDFRLHYEWSRNGRREHPRRSGAVLHTSDGPRRLPLWMKRALDLADDFDATRPVEDHWRALAEFRRAIEPDDVIDPEMPANREMAQLSMTAFLRGLEVRIADRFSIAPDASLGQFEIVPYSSERLDSDGIADDEISEQNAELTDEALAVFQHRLHTRGARPAFQLGNNSYLVIERGAAPVLEELARAQKATREERRAFIENPRSFITHAVNRHLEATGAFEGLEAAEQEEMVEAVAGPALVESREYSERVTGVTVYQRPQDPIEGSGTTWLPEAFAQHLAEAIQTMSDGELHSLRQHMAEVLENGGDTPAEINGENVKVTPARLAAIDGEIERRESMTMPGELDEGPGQTSDADGPIILDTLDNFEELSWEAQFAARTPNIPTILPEEIRTPLHQHQIESFDWALAAWRAGLPGVLNADEQGLGKTLQTIAFLTWLKEHMKQPASAHRGPILIVAPTSLLRNWEQEVETHVEGRGFGTLIRLYGGSLGSQKRRDSQGTETQSGLPQLDLDWLDEAFEDGRAHRYWLLTTYTTLANYQHSLGRVPFSAMVMDEIQNIKNRNTLASKAVEAMNADFRLGLTGTPIENAAIDLWTIMDRIAPGCLGSGTEFRERYAEPNAENMADLHARIFKPNGRRPPLGLRRLKDEVARDLPQKRRFLHPRLMPKEQADAYDLAQLKLANGGPGAALKMLHHIRSVSVHPGVSGAEPPEQFIAKSARLDAVIDILHRIREAGERVLVFIEHRDMQFRFAEIMRHMFGLDRIDVINGDTPIPRRQEIVNRFQRHLRTDGGFDMLILGPKAAGTGLTLTAATHVIHLSRWWNPAVEEQCNDRVHRIGQSKPVSVHIPMALHPELGAQSFDGLLQSLMQRKRRLAEQALWPMGDSKVDVAGLTEAVASRERGQHGVISEIMAEQFQRDGIAPVSPGADGSYALP
ncbi:MULTISPECIES: DEAD/DEAH box helicase [unclassified Marinovum]|uniref:DEAD/DEAH box helicase n=1 Tax=unclassified Marinovum TaxID=2647166 RepID=UPI003EDB7D34